MTQLTAVVPIFIHYASKEGRDCYLQISQVAKVEFVTDGGGNERAAVYYVGDTAPHIATKEQSAALRTYFNGEGSVQIYP